MSGQGGDGEAVQGAPDTVPDASPTEAGTAQGPRPEPWCGPHIDSGLSFGTRRASGEVLCTVSGTEVEEVSVSV